MDLAIIVDNSLHKLVKADTDKICQTCSLFEKCKPLSNGKFLCDLAIYSNIKDNYHFRKIDIKIIFT